MRVLLYLALLGALGGCGAGGEDGPQLPGLGQGQSPSVPDDPPPDAGDDPAPPDTDDIPPGNLESLGDALVTMRSVTVQWTASGDDGDEGTVAGYEVSLQCGEELCPVEGADFEPRSAGETEVFTVAPLESATEYTVLVQAYDEAGNFSNQLTFDARTLDANGWTFELIHETDQDGFDDVLLSIAPDGQPAVTFDFGAYAQRDGSGWQVNATLAKDLGLDDAFQANVGKLIHGPSGHPAILWKGTDFASQSPNKLIFAERTEDGWGLVEEIASGGFEDGGLHDNSGAVAYVNGAPHVAYVGVETFTEAAQRYRLLVKHRLGPDDWSAPELVLSCPNTRFNNFQTPWLGNLFAFALPADPALGLPERLAVVSASWDSGVFVHVSDGSGGWQTGHTGPLSAAFVAPVFFTLTADGRIALAFADGESFDEPTPLGVVFIDVAQLVPLGLDCELPTTLNQTVEFLPDEQIGASGRPSALWSGPDALHLLGSPLLSPRVPIHELQLQSQCGGAWSSETLDTTTGAPYFGPLLGSDGNAVIAYGTRGAYYFATREGTACE